MNDLFIMVSLTYLAKERTSIDKWRAALHLGELWAVLEFGPVGAQGHLVKDWTISLLSEFRGSSVGASRRLFPLEMASSSR